MSAKVSPSLFEIPKSPKSFSLLKHLKPIFKFGRIFGMVPFCLNKNYSQLTTLASNCYYYWHRYLLLLISAAYIAFQATSLIISIARKKPVIQLVSQSAWLNATIISFMLTFFGIFRSKGFKTLFESWIIVEKRVAALFCPVMTKMNIHMLYGMYVILGLASAALCFYHAISLPLAPVYPTTYFYPLDGNETFVFAITDSELGPSFYVVYVVAIIQFIIILWEWMGFGVLEITCCIFSKVLVQSMVTIQEGLKNLPVTKGVHYTVEFSKYIIVVD